MKRILITLALAITSTSSATAATEPSTTPKPVPLTRPETKTALEALKDREPRLPLPAVSEGEPSVNNGRMRAMYLPESWGANSNRSRRNDSGSQRTRGGDPNARLDYLYTVPCFWIVSRANNCHYCLGHQELKLRAAGMDDDTIAALDCDWSQFDPRQQVALEFARKLTLEPHLVNDADVEKLKEHLVNDEVIELVYTVARFNATNRWTDGMGIPQDRRFHGDRANTLTTSTSDEYRNRKSIVVPATRAAWPPVASLAEIEREVTANAGREPRVTLPTDKDARQALTDVIGDRPPQAWERALAALPASGPAQVKTWNTILSDDHLTPRLKAEIAFLTAVNNQAWYAAAHAAHRLQQLGASAEDLTSLLGDHEPSEGGAAAAYRLATKSTRDPHLIADADLAAVREHFSDSETAQIMQVICIANLFDRFTAALGLPVERSTVDGQPFSKR